MKKVKRPTWRQLSKSKVTHLTPNLEPALLVRDYRINEGVKLTSYADKAAMVVIMDRANTTF